MKIDSLLLSLGWFAVLNIRGQVWCWRADLRRCLRQRMMFFICYVCGFRWPQHRFCRRSMLTFDLRLTVELRRLLSLSSVRVQSLESVWGTLMLDRISSKELNLAVYFACCFRTSKYIGKWTQILVVIHRRATRYVLKNLPPSSAKAIRKERYFIHIAIFPPYIQGNLRNRVPSSVLARSDGFFKSRNFHEYETNIMICWTTVTNDIEKEMRVSIPMKATWSRFVEDFLLGE